MRFIFIALTLILVLFLSVSSELIAIPADIQVGDLQYIEMGSVVVQDGTTSVLLCLGVIRKQE